MPVRTSEFTALVTDLMQCIGPVNSRPMFGGYGLFLQGLMCGLIANDVLYLKVDEQSKPAFLEQGLQPFEYERQGKRFAMSYYEAPEDVFDDIEIMRDWASMAYEAALRSAKKK